MTIRLVVTRPDLPGDAVARLIARDDVTAFVRPVHEAMTTAEARDLIATADVVLATGMDRLDATVFSDARPDGTKRVLATTSTGTDHIDLSAATASGFAVTNVPAVMTESCADYTFGLILAARRRIAETDRRIRDGQWHRSTMSQWLGADVHGRRLGLIGFGQIARAVARRAAGFTMDVVHHDRSRTTSDLSTWIDLDELFSTSDIISLHVPLTPTTHHLIDAAALAGMRPDATLVNTSRGAVVDTDALVQALVQNRLAGAALDVFESEPMSDPDHPLCRLPNVVLAPHAASATVGTRVAMIDRAVANIEAVLAGRPPLDPIA